VKRLERPLDGSRRAVLGAGLGHVIRRPWHIRWNGHVGVTQPQHRHAHARVVAGGEHRFDNTDAAAGSHSANCHDKRSHRYRPHNVGRNPDNTHRDIGFVTFDRTDEQRRSCTAM
jgi:hypothetical protein